MISKIIVAAIQMTSTSSLSENLKSAYELISLASKKGAEVILLPENFALMGLIESDKTSIAESDEEGPIQLFLSQTALKLGIWLIGGTIPIHGPTGKVYSSCLTYNPKGDRVGRYDKIHLFDVQLPETNESYQESKTFCEGLKTLVINTLFGRIGFSICYDVRFPELYRKMALSGVDIFVVPSAFTSSTGAAHWETLIRARAIENQCYVVAANQVGFHENGRKTYGHSMIVDPWGKILSCIADCPGFAIAEIDLTKLTDIRKHFPVLDHARAFLR